MDRDQVLADRCKELKEFAEEQPGPILAKLCQAIEDWARSKPGK